jgi:hypothetical protein
MFWSLMGVKVDRTNASRDVGGSDEEKSGSRGGNAGSVGSYKVEVTIGFISSSSEESSRGLLGDQALLPVNLIALTGADDSPGRSSTSITSRAASTEVTAVAAFR